MKRVLCVLVLLCSLTSLASACQQPSAGTPKTSTYEGQPVYNQAFISDQDFEDYNAMSLDEIRAFLSQWNSCLQGQIQDVDGQSFEPAQIIYEAAQANHISPKVLLATMEKEQQAITSTQLPENQLALLMGAGSSSTAKHQILYAAQLFRSYLSDLDTKGITISGWKVVTPRLTEDGVEVTPANRAVAALFTYTPYAGAQWGGNQPQWGGNYLFYDAWYNKFHFGEAFISTPELTPTTPTSTYEAAPFGNGVIIGDFSISLSRVERITGETRRLNALICTDDYAALYFAIRRIDISGGDQALVNLEKINIIDDHNNTYSDDGFGRLEWEDSLAGVSFSLLPVGFTWVEEYDVVMPIAAPIVKIQILNDYHIQNEVAWEIDYLEYQFESLDLEAELPESISISPEQTISQGEWLQWSIGEIYLVDVSDYQGQGKKHIEQEYLISFSAENRDYDIRGFHLDVRLQLSNGEIRPAGPLELHVGGYFFDSLETDPYRPAYAIQPGYVSYDIPGQSNTRVTYYRLPVLEEEAGNKPVKILIFSGDEMYILEFLSFME